MKGEEAVKQQKASTRLKQQRAISRKWGIAGIPIWVEGSAEEPYLAVAIEIMTGPDGLDTRNFLDCYDLAISMALSDEAPKK